MGRAKSAHAVQPRCFQRATRFLPLALIASAAFGCSSKKVDANPAASAAPIAVTTPDLLAEALWRDNQTYVFALELSSSAGVAGALPLAQYEMQGDLIVNARKSSANSAQLAIHVADARFRTNKREAEPMYDALSKELSQGYLITLAEGAITEERIAKNTSAFAETIFRYLGASLQLRAAVGQRALDATERDLTGVYHTSYDANRSGTELIRTKLRYDPVPVGGKGPAAGVATMSANVENSKATIKLNDHVLQSLEQKETLGAPVANGSAVSSTTALKLTLKRTSATVSIVPWDKLVQDGIATQAGHMIANPSKDSQFDDLRIGTYTFDKALAEMTASAKTYAKRLAKEEATGRPGRVDPSVEKKEISAEEKTFTAMVALMRRDVANIDRATLVIDKKDVAAPQLMDALASAGTAYAQRALATIAGDAKVDKTSRLRSLIALARVPNATQDTVDALTKLLHVHGFETAACYGLGTISRRLRDSGAFAQADAIVDTLLKELSASKNEDWSVVVLRGIANSGNAKAFDTVEPFLKESSVRLREAAVESVRLMLEPRVNTVLQNVIANETDDSVRVAALDGCAMRPMNPALLRAVSSAGLTGKSTRVRQRAIQVLAAWAPQNPDALSALKSVTALESNPHLRREAETAEQRASR